MRPNLHIADYCEAVDLLILADKNKIKNEIFNVGYQNLSIYQIAKLVKKVVENQFIFLVYLHSRLELFGIESLKISEILKTYQLNLRT